MRMIAFSVAIFALSACQTVSTTDQPDQRQTKSDMVESLFATFNAHDSQKLSSFYTEDAHVFSPESCEPTIGKAAIAEHYQKLFDEIPDVHDALQTTLIDGDTIAVTFIASSRIEGRAFELPIAAFMTLEDGLISKDEAYFDSDMTPDCS